MKAFYKNLNSVYGPKSSGSFPIMSADDVLLKDRNDILKRWAEQFSSVLNITSSVDDKIIDSIPQRPMMHHLSSNPTLDEVKSAIKQLSSGKAAGEDGIPPEVFKHGGDPLTIKLTELFCEIWNQGSVPQQFKDASIIHLFKNKGKKAVCDNHRGISLLSIAGKILARVILNRINTHVVDSIYPESQCGFRPGRGTNDMIFSLRQVQENLVNTTRIFICFLLI